MINLDVLFHVIKSLMKSFFGADVRDVISNCTMVNKVCYSYGCFTGWGFILTFLDVKTISNNCIQILTVLSCQQFDPVSYYIKNVTVRLSQSSVYGARC